MRYINIFKVWNIFFLFQPSVDDGLNGRNNVVTVKKSDFEVMEALTSDSILTNQSSGTSKQQCKFFEISNILITN
jgi:hypothetical protein